MNMECQKQKKSYFYCEVIFSLLCTYKHYKCSIFIAYQNYIYVAPIYFRCNPIFPLQAYIFIACTYLYCKLIFVLPAHIFIASPYFYCKHRFLLQAHIFVATSWKYFPRSAKNLSRCLKNFSRSSGM